MKKVISTTDHKIPTLLRTLSTQFFKTSLFHIDLVGCDKFQVMLARSQISNMNLSRGLRTTECLRDYVRVTSKKQSTPQN